MCSSVRSLLDKWELAHHWTTFEDNNLTSVKKLMLLTPELIREVIEPVGDRVIFCDKLKNSKAQRELESSKEIEFNPSHSGTSLSKSSIPKDSSCQFDKTFQELLEIEVRNQLSQLSPEKSNDFSNSLTQEKKTEETDPEIRISSKRKAISSTQENRPSKRLVAWESKNTFKNLNLTQILESSVKGDAVLNYFLRKKVLNSEARGILLEIIANKVIEINLTPSVEEYSIISKKICELFPSECEDTYFFLPFSNGSQQKNSCGKLPDKIRNTKSILRRLGALYPSNYQSTQTENEDNFGSFSSGQQESAEEVDSAVRWLTIGRDPWPDVMINWSKTFHIQQATLIDPNGGGPGEVLSLSAYCRKWEVLTLPQGYKLLELDFKQKYPDKHQAFILNWEIFSSILHDLLKSEVKDVYGKILLKKLESLAGDTKDAIILHLLPHLCPPRQKGKSSAGDKLKANISKARDAFILHVTVPGDLIPAILRRRNNAAILKKRVQPFIVVIGPSLDKYNECYVVIDDLKYQFSSFLKAFDICFKAIHALMVEYSFEVSNVWLFVQKAIYKIDLKSDRKDSNVAALVKSFSALVKNSETVVEGTESAIE